MGVWRIGFGLYGERETWIPDRGMPNEWPECSDAPPCDICMGMLERRKYEYTGKDNQPYTGYRYTLTHYGRRHDAYRTTERRRSA